MNSFLFTVFGIRMSVARMGIAVFWLLDLIALYLVARVLMPRKFAVLAPFLALLWSPIAHWVPWASWYSIPAAMFSLFFMLKYLQEERKRHIALAGLAAGISFFFKQSTGTYALVAMMAIYCVCGLQTRSEEPDKSGQTTISVLLLRVTGIILGFFVFPLLLLRDYSKIGHIVFLLIPLASLGILSLAVVFRFHKAKEVRARTSGNYQDFFLPPAIAVVVFFGVFALWCPIASRGFGFLNLVDYLLMLRKSDFVYAGSILKLTPPPSFATFVPVLFYCSLGMMGALFIWRARPAWRALVFGAILSGDICLLLLLPEAKPYILASLQGTSAWMVLFLHLFTLFYLLRTLFLNAHDAGQLRRNIPLLSVLIFSNFFFLQLFPLNSLIHLRWSLNAWFLIAAWSAYKVHMALAEGKGKVVRNALDRGVRYGIAVLPITLYFGLGVIFSLLAAFFSYAFFIGLTKPGEPFRNESAGWLKVHPRAHIEITPVRFIQPDLERVDVRMPAHTAQAFEMLVKYIKANTSPYDFVFGPNLNFINFAADVPSPLSENYFFPGWVSRAEEIEMRRLLAIYRPKFVIFFESDYPTDVMGTYKFKNLHPHVAEYLDSRYSEHLRIGPFRVAHRK